MRQPENVIIKQFISDKSDRINSDHNQVTFKVAMNANKIEIKRAVEELFKVVVTNVNVMNVKGKKKRLGRFQGRRSNWKKAIVTLTPESTINFYEGV